METPTIKLVNAQTGKEVEREMTENEFAKFEKVRAELEAKVEAEAQATAHKAAAEAKLTALGLTPEDLKALGLA